MDINEVARLAGVSRATVSRYFNDGYVSKEKRELIAKVVRETGYAPSQQAKTLRTGKTMIVDLVATRIACPAVTNFTVGLSKALNARGYRVVLTTCDDRDGELAHLKSLVTTRQADGVVFIGTLLDDELEEAIRTCPVPVVLIGQRLEGVSHVAHDDRGAVREIAAHVLETSAHPAYLGAPEDIYSISMQRRLGFLDACAEAGVQVPEDAVDSVPYSIADARVRAEQLLDAHPETDAIVCSADIIAYGVLALLNERGISVPEDVQVTGVGDDSFSDSNTANLSTARTLGVETGSRAAGAIFALMADASSGPRHDDLGYELVWRGTTR